MKKYTGKTLNDVLNAAAKEKGVSVEELTYFVTEEKQGFLGIGASVTAEVYASCDVKEFLFNYIGEFFTGLNQDVEIEIFDEDGGYRIMLNAENNAVIIGKNGQTLQALNTVVRGAVNSAFRKRFSIMIDINHYKEERYEKVKSIAGRIAKTVQRTKVDASLDPMPNDERKVIHQYLADWPYIKTESGGEGSRRHLKIMYDRTKTPNKK